MKLAAQIIIALLLVSGWLFHFYWNVNGRPAMEPKGFPGVVGTLIAIAIQIALYLSAGLFSEFR